ncbi:MAG: sialate O-acetylesterase, partial [Bacteroidota bacterium]|nr:sialate O-acetylesterase [Bacteroidota bacterium]
MRKTYFLISLCLLALFLPAYLSICNAAVVVGHTFSNHMVLQRDMPVPVWGTASPGEKVTVTFNGQTKSVVTPGSGKWMMKLNPMKAAGPLTMTIQGSNTLTFSDAYVGEVWQCAGQSNMDTRMNFYPSYKDTITNTNIPLLRFMVTRKGPED